MIHRLSMALVMAVLLASSAHAQIVGTFKWQTQPYCNIVTLTIVQQGGMYQLTGADDLCGSGAAPATGTAVVTAGGVALGFTTALPTGRAAHITATVNLASASGAWTDADGNSGTFLFTVGGSTAGVPRPAPVSAALITTAQLASTIYSGTGSATTVARGDHDHDTRYYTQTQADAAHNALLTKASLGPRGLIGQALVSQSVPSLSVARASNGQTISVTRPFLGTSQVAFPGFAGAPGGSFDQVVQITPADFNMVCAVVSRSTTGTTFRAQVNCINPSTLAAVDGAFFITVTS